MNYLISRRLNAAGSVSTLLVPCVKRIKISWGLVFVRVPATSCLKHALHSRKFLIVDWKTIPIYEWKILPDSAVEGWPIEMLSS